jgi:hypothetical protein
MISETWVDRECFAAPRPPRLPSALSLSKGAARDGGQVAMTAWRIFYECVLYLVNSTFYEFIKFINQN